MDPSVVNWRTSALDLVRASSYSERINPLLDNPFLGTIPYDCDDRSNCFGTVLYLLGIVSEERPLFVDRKDMVSFLEKHCTPKKTPDGLVGFWEVFRDEQILTHAGLYLGEASGMETLFHQPGTGERFDLLPIPSARIDDPIKIRVAYYEALPSAKSFELSPRFTYLR